MSITLPVEFKTVPGSLDAELRRATREAEKQLKEVARATERAAAEAARTQARQLKYVDDLKRKYFLEEQRRVEREVKDRISAEARKLRETEKSLKALAGAVGLLNQRAAGWLSGAGEIVGAVDDMSPKTLALAGAFTVVGVAVTAAVAAAAAFVAGTAAVVAGIIGTVTAAEKLAVALKPLRDQEGFGISKSALDGIKAANDAMASLGAIAKQVVVAMGAEFAPAVEQVSFLMVKLGLMALDAFNAFASGGNVLRTLSEFLVNAFVQALTLPINRMLDMIGVIGDLAEAAGATGLAQSLVEVRGRWDGFVDGLASNAINFVVAEFEMLNSATADYDERARKLIETVGKMRVVTAAEAKDLDKVRDALFQSLEVFNELAMLQAEGALAKGTKDIRNHSDAYLDLSKGVEGAADDTIELILWEAEFAAQMSRGNLTVQERIDLELLLADAMKAREEAAKKAAEQKVVSTLNSLQGGLEGIATLLAGPVAGAVVGLVLDLEDTIKSLKEELLALPATLKAVPKLLTGLVVTVVEQVVPGLIKAAPKIAEGFALAVSSPEFIAAITKAAVFLSSPFRQFAFWVKVGTEIMRGFWESFKKGWESFASGEMIDSFKQALLLGFVDAIATLRAFFEELIDRIKGLFSGEGVKETASKGADTIKEIFTLGAAKTSTYGDSPGPVRSPAGGMWAFVPPDDYFNQARDRKQLQQQAGGSARTVPAVIDLADGHLAFDGQLRRATKQPRTRRELLGFTVARGLA